MSVRATLVMVAVLAGIVGLGYAMVSGFSLNLTGLYEGVRDTIGGYWDGFVGWVNSGLARADPRNWANEGWTKELNPKNWDWTAKADPRNWDSPFW